MAKLKVNKAAQEKPGMWNYPYFQVTRSLIPDIPSFTPLRPAISERPHAGLRINSSPIKLPLTGLSTDVDK